MGKLRIDILGESFAVQASEDTDYLKKLLSYYKEITNVIQEGSHVANPLQASILAGINLVDELFKARKLNYSSKKELDEDQTERITLEMIEKIDEVIN